MHYDEITRGYCAWVSGNWKNHIDSKLVIVCGYSGTGKTTLISSLSLLVGNQELKNYIDIKQLIARVYPRNCQKNQNCYLSCPYLKSVCKIHQNEYK